MRQGAQQRVPSGACVLQQPLCWTESPLSYFVADFVGTTKCPAEGFFRTGKALRFTYSCASVSARDFCVTSSYNLLRLVSAIQRDETQCRAGAYPNYSDSASTLRLVSPRFTYGKNFVRAFRFTFVSPCFTWLHFDRDIPR